MDDETDCFEELLSEGGEISRGDVGAKPPKLNYTHDAMIDLILCEPAISQNDVARRFGYSPAWVSTIMTSDAFRARLAERREELIDPVVRARAEVNLKAMILRSQEVIMEKLNAPTHQISDGLALRAFEISTRAAGLGIKDPPAAPVDINIHLGTLQENLVKMIRTRKREVIDADMEELDGL